MARRGAPAQAEMGGHNPAIVLDDADPGAAAAAIVSGAMGYAGQKCTATRRAIALPGVYDALADALAERLEALRVGEPLEEETEVGPLIDQRAADDFAAALRGALDAGGRELGRAPDPPAEGHFVRPAIVALDDPTARANQEETFGPLLTLLRARDEEHALELANGTRYGLVGAVHSRDAGRGAALARRLRCGMQRVNAPTPGVDYYAPFGGTGDSSFGPREQGRAAREFFTSYRTLTVSPPPTS
jgi:aldehyde dehydrogenase (NAD+)